MTMKHAKFFVAGMDCPAEVKLIRGRLEGAEGIRSLRFNLLERELTVEHELTTGDSIARALDDLGMKPERLSEKEAPKPVARARRREDVLLGVAGVTAVAAEAIEVVAGRERTVGAFLLAALTLLLAGRKTLGKGLVAIRTFSLNINFLMSIAVAGALVIGKWPEAAMVTFLFAVAERIEVYSVDRARSAIRGLMEMAPDRVWVRRGGEWAEIDASAAELGDTFRVRPGERVALDGTVTSGRSTVNQAPITGESMPIEKGPGDALFAGTLNEAGAMEARITARAAETTLARIIRSVEEAPSARAPSERFVDRFSRYYTPLIVFIAVLVATVPPLASGEGGYVWLYRALVLLVIACPCALVISTPVTLVSALAASAKRGILVKGGAYLEAGRSLRAIALDKTGTLTHGRPALTDVVVLGEDMAREEVLRLAASLDALSDHPVARAIVEVVRRDVAGPLFEVTEFQSLTGRGVRGTIDGRAYFLGNQALAEERGVCSPSIEETLRALEAQGKTAVVLGTDGRALAVLAVRDTVRASSREAVAQLHALGITTVLLSGDNAVTARAIAAEVGVRDVRGDLLPDAKVEAVRELLASHGSVGMVGDGVNDAPALAASTVGFAMGAAGTDTAIETADVALMDDDPLKLAEFVRSSRRAMRVLAANIALAIGTKLVFLALAVAGVATLWMAVFADMGTSLIVVANGLRLLRAPPIVPRSQ